MVIFLYNLYIFVGIHLFGRQYLNHVASKSWYTVLLAKLQKSLLCNMFFVFFFRQKTELLALSAYVGALVSIRRGYTSIVPPLFNNAR